MLLLLNHDIEVVSSVFAHLGLLKGAAKLESKIEKSGDDGQPGRDIWQGQLAVRLYEEALLLEDVSKPTFRSI